MRVRAALALGAGLAGVALLYSGLALRAPVMCFFRRITGLPCPSCGMTRAMAALTHGDLRRAVEHNAGVWLVAMFALGLGSLLVLELVTGRSWIERVWAIRRVRIVTAVLVIATMSFAWAENLVARWRGGPSHAWGGGSELHPTSAHVLAQVQPGLRICKTGPSWHVLSG